MALKNSPALNAPTKTITQAPKTGKSETIIRLVSAYLTADQNQSLKRL
jgi:hypothetical protein